MALAEITMPRAVAEGRKTAGPDTLAALVAEVAGIVGDPAVGEAEIVRCCNRGLWAASGLARLPGLATWRRVALASGQGDAPLPADLQHGPTDAFLLPGRGRVRVATDLAALRRTIRYGARGRVRFLAAGAGRFFVRPAPETAVEIELGYYRLPQPLVAAWDKPEGLPPHLAGPLLVNFACRELFERLEEGSDGKKVQASAYGRRYEAALAELLAFCGPAARQDEPADIAAGPGDPWTFGEDWP